MLRRTPLRRKAQLKSRINRIPASVRQAVLLRDKGRCRVCGTWQERLDLHHVLPRGRGGKNDIGNLIAVCRRCHLMIHRRPAWAMERGYLRSGYKTL